MGGTPVYYDRKGKERGFVSNFDSRRGEKKKRKRLLEVVEKLIVQCNKNRKTAINHTNFERVTLFGSPTRFLKPYAVKFDFFRKSTFLFLRSVKLSGGGTFNSFFSLPFAHGGGVKKQGTDIGRTEQTFCSLWNREIARWSPGAMNN